MIRSLYTASTAMYAQQLNMDTISHNLSNVNTTGFKKSRPVFSDLLYSKLPQPDVGKTISTLELGTGVRVVASRRDFSDGSPVSTEQPLDVALQGRGFLAVRLPNGGTGYTRHGGLQVSLGKLTDSNGYAVLNAGGGEITVPSEIRDLAISNSGEIFGITAAGKEQSLGHLGVGLPADQHLLSAYGGGVYTSPGTAPLGKAGEGGRARLLPGFLEMANVQVVEEMVSLITAQRAYEVGSKAVQAADDMLGQANNLRR